MSHIDKSAVEYMKFRAELDPTDYINGLQRRISDELRSKGNSEALQHLSEAAVSGQRLHSLDVIAVYNLVREFNKSQSHRELKGEKAESFERVDIGFLYNIDFLNRMCRSEAFLNSMRGEADLIIHEAWGKRKSIIEDAEEKAAEIRSLAESDARRIREQAIAAAGIIQNKLINEARERAGIEAADIRLRAAEEAAGIKAHAAQEAEAEAERALCSAREQAEARAEEYYRLRMQEFVPRSIKDAIESYRSEDNNAYAVEADKRVLIAENYAAVRRDICTGVTNLQADLLENITRMQQEMNAKLISWREGLYKVEMHDLAGCVLNLHSILLGLDQKIDAACAEDRNAEAQLVSIRKNLGRFEEQLRQALLGVGMEVYFPQAGDAYDPAVHIADQGDEGEGMVIASCIKPGVRHSGNTVYRAEVVLRAAEIVEKKSGDDDAALIHETAVRDDPAECLFTQVSTADQQALSSKDGFCRKILRTTILSKRGDDRK